MKFIVLLACVALAAGAPVHPKPERGAYNFSYSTVESAKSEIGEANGSVRGAYTYIDDTGAVHKVQYIAGPELGFKVVEDSVDLSSAKISKEFPLAHEIKLVDGLTPEVAAATSAHLNAYKAIRALLPELNEEEEASVNEQLRKAAKPRKKLPESSQREEVPSEGPKSRRNIHSHPFEVESVNIHRLRNQVPATVHRTFVPDHVQSEVAPPVRSRNVVETHRIPAAVQSALIDGLTPDVAAAKEAQLSYNHALNKLLPQLKEQGEIIIPVHHVHHVHQEGNIEHSAPRVSHHQVKVTNNRQGQIVQQIRRVEPVVEVAEEPRKVHVVQKEVDYPLASEIELIEGFTPEVYAERQAHLAHHAAIKALLPEIDEELE